MAAFALALLIAGPVLCLILFITKAEKELADAETVPLGSSVSAFLPAGSVVLIVLMNLLVFFLCGRLLIAIGVYFKVQLANLIQDGFHLSITGLAVFLMFASGKAAIKNLTNLVLRTRLNPSAKPTISIDLSGITFEENSFPWSEVDDFTTYTVSAPRGGSWSYAMILPKKDSPLSLTTFKNRSWSLFCAAHRKEIRRNLSLENHCFFLLPLYGLTKPEIYLGVISKRYWGAASGGDYKPESIEARYPQKRFEDYAQK